MTTILTDTTGKRWTCYCSKCKKLFPRSKTCGGQCFKCHDDSKWERMPDSYIRKLFPKSERRSLTPEMIAAKRVGLLQWRAGIRKPKKPKPFKYPVGAMADAWQSEQRAFRTGDEQSHWSNHPAVRPYLVSQWMVKNGRKKPEGHRRNYRRNYCRQRRATDPMYKISGALRGRLRVVLKRQKATKHKPTLDLIGCSIKFLRNWLSQQFQPGMSWENYGPVWHVDHVKPCISFDLKRTSEQRKCFHYTNLQPLWKFDNISKGGKTMKQQDLF